MTGTFMSSIVGRLVDAASKLLFCIRISAGSFTLIRLLVNTKKFSAASRSTQAQFVGEKPQQYSLRLAGTKQPVYLRTYSGDLQIFYEIFWRRAYGIAGINFSDCKVIVDLGGHVGVSALYFHNRAPRAALWVLEPDAANLSIAKQNLAQVAGNVTLLHAAAANHSGTLFVQSDRFAFNSKTGWSGNGVPVNALSCNDLFSQNKIIAVDLLKIDIEGFETDLFTANTEWLRLVRYLIIEIHSEQAFLLCSSTLQRYGYLLCAAGRHWGSAGIYHAQNQRLI